MTTSAAARVSSATASRSARVVAALAALRERGTGARGAVGGTLTPALRRLRIATPLGWGIAVASAASAVLGILFGWGEFVAVAVTGALLIVFAVPYVLGRLRYEVRVELAAQRVTVGRPAVGRLVVRSPGGVTRSAWMMLPVGAARARFRVPRLDAEGEHEELFQIPTNRRAVLAVGPATSMRTDPVGVLRREVRWNDPTLLYVHPRIVSLAGETTGLARDLDGLPARDLADDDISFHALREYAPGDDLRHVHWKSTARTQTLMIRQYEQTRRSRLVIALSTRADEYDGEEDFELAVSIAASVAVSAMLDGAEATLLTSTEAFTEPTVQRLLDRFASVELATRADRPGPIEALGRQAERTVPTASAVVFVAGAATETPRLHRAALRVPVSATAQALRAVPAGALQRRMIGGFAAADVPDLDSLRRAVRAVSA